MGCNLCHHHVHSQYSALDGYIRIDELIRQVGEYKQPAITLTDHGTLSGTLELFNACEKWNVQGGHQIKPIIGMEAYIVRDRTIRVKGEPNAHLLLIARNETGYRNLLKLHYQGYATGAVYIYDRIVPRIDQSLLTPENCKGLIATTGCLGSEFAILLREDKWDEAKALAEKYKKLFDIFVGEIQPTYLIGTDQAEHNEKIKRLARLVNVPVICTTDAHYLTEEERKEHQLVLAIQSKKDIYDEDRFTFEATPLLSTEEMLDTKWWDGKHLNDQIVITTERLAEKCDYPDFLRFESHGYRLPKYPIPALEEYERWHQQHPEHEDPSYAYLMFLIEQNWDKRLRHTKDDTEKVKEYMDRLKMEVETIKDMGFVDYFLIVSDFTNWCKEEGIPIGCGRGSAGGCLLSYLLGITKLDPIKYELLFSRFLNKDRISLPDIDIDIDKSRRDEVKAYLARKYGQDRVASIATFGTMKVRACIKDIVRSLRKGGSKSVSFELAEQINKTLEGQSDDITYKEALEIPGFKQFMDANPDVAFYTKEFEGLVRQTGIHAAGVIIGPEPLTNTMPLMMDKNGVVATAYDGTTLEKDGFLKMDLLGLKTLTVIKDCIENIKKVRGEEFKGYHVTGIKAILDEPEIMFEKRLAAAPKSQQFASRAYKLLRDGKTNGVFQVECLSGDTIIGYKGTIKDLYEKYISDQFTNYNNKTSSIHLNNGNIFQNKILKVVKSGKKKVFRVVTSDNRFIKASAKHQFLTSEGWKELQDLQPGDEVLVKQTGYMRVCEKCGSEMQQWIKSTGWTNQTKCKRCSALETENSTKLLAHKKNSQTLAEFQLKYKSLCNWECPQLPEETIFVEINRIEECNEEETYDICMEAPAHNYIANGFVVHNSQGMRDLLNGVYVNSIEEIAAVLALNRPGPLASGMTAEYGKRKRMETDCDEWYIHPSLKPVLKNTYGVTAYQEQVMQIAMRCAGFSESEADTLRKAVGKKIRALMDKQKERFVKGCQRVAKMDEPTAEKLWGDIEAFASYGFNKSHAVGYAHTTYQTAYLKANYPAEFCGALLSNEAAQDKITSYIREATNMGIRILPVDVNESTMRYEVVDTSTIRRDMVTMSGVGAKAVEDILAKRPFKNMVDFLSRTDTKRVNSRVIETLIKGGAFDHAFEEEEVGRKAYFDYYNDCRKKIKRFIKRAQEKDEQYLPPEYQGKTAKIRVADMDRLTYLLLTNKKRKTIDEIMDNFPGYDWHNPVNLKKKTVGTGKNKRVVEEEIPVERKSKDSRDEWNGNEIVEFEERIYGMSVTYNRFDFHQSAEEAFKRECDPLYSFVEKLDEYEDKERVYMMVYVRGCERKSPYRKDPDKFVRRYRVEDRTGEGVLTVFDGTYKKDPLAWKEGHMLILRCRVNIYNERKSLVAEEVLQNCGTIDGRR